MCLSLTKGWNYAQGVIDKTRGVCHVIASVMAS